MDRRAFMGSLGVYGSLLAGARAQGTSRAPKLKIREIRAVRMKGINSRFVRVYTDQGLTGTGETLDTVGAADIINKDMGPSLVGRDPLDIEKIYFDLFSFPPVFRRGNGGGPYVAAMSGIDMALWDLAGKAMGLPVYRLMGGRVRDKIAVYFHSHEPKDAVDYVKRTGVKAIKTQIGMVAMADNNEFGWDPGKVANMTLTNRQIEDIAKHTASMREALGPDFGIALECHTQFDTESALQVCKAVEPYRPLWVEEPVPSDNVDAMAFIRSHSRVPIACGENVYGRFGARPYFEKQAISMFQLDMAKCGGLLESRKMAALAEVYHIPIAPHGVATKLGIAAYAHVCSTVPNFMVLEWLHYRDDAYNKLTTSPEYADGFLKVPEAPGIGVEVNEDAVKELLMPGYPML